MKFIDLFCGIGGFHEATKKFGNHFECVFASDIDEHSKIMYEKNHHIKPFGDITKIKSSEIPDFDILFGGFPCQAFSAAGKKKGFEDVRGTLFFEIARILKDKNPEKFILENVENLKHHDKGNTFKTIITILEELNYKTSFNVLNAIDFGVPQNRKRMIIVGQKNDYFNFSNIKKEPFKPLEKFLEDDNENFSWLSKEQFTLIEKPKKQEKSQLIFSGYINKNIRKNGITNFDLTLSRVHKQPNRIYSSKGSHPTLSSQETAGRYYIEINGNVRKMTINECYRIMGFDDKFEKVGSKAQLYNRIGNSICVPMVEKILESLIEK